MNVAIDIVRLLLEDNEDDLDPKDYIDQQGMWIEFGPEVEDLPTESGYYCAFKHDDNDPDLKGQWWFEGGWDNLEDAAQYYDAECGDRNKIILLDAPNRRGKVIPYTRHTEFNSDPNGPKAGYLDSIDRFLRGS